MDNCLFCQINSGNIPANLVYRDDNVIAINDIAPQAPVHVLIIPTLHIANINDVTPNNQQVIGQSVLVAKQLAKQLDIDNSGYRLVWNTNAAAQQTVFHLHLHLLGGRDFTWPPG